MAKNVVKAAASTGPLTETEGADLARLEATVERGRSGFMEVGAALGEISKRRLYRATHRTFEAYCRERWGIGKSYAGKQIRAAKVVAALGGNPQTGTAGPVSPIKESVARPLTALKEPKDQQKAWHKAVRKAQAAGRRAPNAGDVRESVAGLVLSGGKIDKLASQRASRERSVETSHDTARVQHMRSALASLNAAAKADDDRWATKIGAQADRVETLLGHVLTADRR